MRVLTEEQETLLNKFQNSFNSILFQVEGMSINSLERKCYGAKESFDAFLNSINLPADMLRIPNIYSHGK